MQISGWGRCPKLQTTIVRPTNEAELLNHIKRGELIARGNGRSYGDSSISKTKTINMKKFNRFLHFDRLNGVLTLEAGVLLKDVIDLILPAGWFPSVTPGTKFVTIGGMIASDVHGKNHHKDGGMGNCVNWIELVTHEGKIIRCSGAENKELFDWTIGGMGLTGIIVRASLKLRRIETAWIKQSCIASKNLHNTMHLFEMFSKSTYSVAWIDCTQKEQKLGRSILFIGEHANLEDIPLNNATKPLETPRKIKRNLPIELPSWILNRFTIKIFNFLYYWKFFGKRANQLRDWDSFFYPLDKLQNWNKIYGKRGFSQFQCVLPLRHAEIGLRALLEKISNTNSTNFLGVLKRLGAESAGLSFPMEGYTLTVDFPMSEKNSKLIHELHKITLEFGGRFYLSKDSQLRPDIFHASDERIIAFKKYRHSSGSENFFKSYQSERLDL